METKSNTLRNRDTLKNGDIVYIKVPILYRADVIYNNKSKEHYKELNEEYLNFKLPKYNDYPKDLTIPKFFTFLPSDAYLSPWMNYDEVLLQYESKNKIGKFVFYDGIIDKVNRDHFNTIKNTVDGYIAIYDVHEIYLLNPIKFLYDNPSEIKPTYSTDELPTLLSAERDIILDNIVD